MYKRVLKHNILCFLFFKTVVYIMVIYGLQKLSLLDFPGKTACTVFTGGCNWRCPFCHNASLVTALNTVEPVPEEEFFAFLKKRQNILDGVCITGGEPLLQPDIIEFIKKVREYGYSIKLDTNGSFPDKLKEIINSGLVDYVAMDIKNSPDKYPLTTGITDVDITAISKSASFLMNSGVDYEFRTTVVKEFHTQADFEKISDWLKGAKCYFLQSFTDSGDILGGTFQANSKDELEKFKAILEKNIRSVSIRGV